MKVIAINIYDFTNWYKFGAKSFPESLLIDLNNSSLTGEELLDKVGFFEEDYEVFLVSIKKDLVSVKSELIRASFYDIEKIIPLSQRASQLLKNKIPDFKFDSSIDESLLTKLLSARNKFISCSGGKMLLNVFGLQLNEKLLALQGNFYSSVEKYLDDLNFDKSSFLDYLVTYERSKPFPVSEIGYLYDTGALLRSYFNLTDDDFKNKNSLEASDKPKFELVEQLIFFSSFLQKCSQDIIWSELIQLFENNKQINTLNKEFAVAESFPDLNSILTTALFLRFRYQIRNLSNLEDKTFLKHIERFASKLPNETAAALLMNGIFFGSLKFKDLAYKLNPPSFSIQFHQQKQEQKTTTEKTKPVSLVETESSDELRERKIESSKQQQKTIPPHIDTFPFDEALLQKLKMSLKSFSKSQWGKVEKAFKFVQNYKEDMFSSQSEFLINYLKKQEKKSTAKKTDNKLSEDQIAIITSALQSLMK